MDSENVLNRKLQLQQLKNVELWDMIIIGGGATGLGVAVDAASRGYKTLLLEQCDFAKGTSSRSTKLVHGGVRYLAQGNVKLVIEALKERGILLENAPHLVHKQSFVIPCYSWFSKVKYLIGLKMYDWLSGRYSFGKSKLLSESEVKELLPGIKERNLKGGIRYFDGQFDDARLAINLAQTAAREGAALLNYMKVTGLKKKGGKISGVEAEDMETGVAYNLASKVVVNATGVFVDDILQMDTPGAKPIVRSSQGVHLVFKETLLPVKSALMIPKTSDGRVLFAVPWHNHILVGTTDTPLESHVLEPVALQKEITFILATLKQYFNKNVERKDVLSVFAGLRPLAAPKNDAGSTKEISRDHKLIMGDSQLITITGGKWTTYRRMGEVTVDLSAKAGLPVVPSRTKKIHIHGWSQNVKGHLSVYGSDAEKISALIRENPAMGRLLKEGYPYTEAEVVWAVRNEMARTVEDVLARRLRLLFLEAGLAVLVAPRVAEIMAVELQKSPEWVEEQIRSFRSLAGQYELEENRMDKENVTTTS